MQATQRKRFHTRRAQRFVPSIQHSQNNRRQDTRMKTIRKQNVLSAALACALAFTITSGQAQDVSPAEARAIAEEAYIYFYPLVLMDVSLKHFTNIEPDKMFGRGPMNTFSHARTFPPATFRGNVRVGMALGTFFLMAGCSAQTGVVPTGQNSYLVAKQAAPGDAK